jgi:protein-L-isoaspartate O-methyltransferase
VSACLSELVGPTGFVFGVEHVAALTTLAKSNLSSCGADRFQNVSIKGAILPPNISCVPILTVCSYVRW